MPNSNIFKIPSNTVFNCRTCDIEVARKSWNQKYCKPCGEQRHKENIRSGLRRYYYRNRKVVHHDWQVKFLDTYGEIYCINCTKLLKSFDLEEWHNTFRNEQCSKRTNTSLARKVKDEVLTKDNDCECPACPNSNYKLTPSKGFKKYVVREGYEK